MVRCKIKIIGVELKPENGVKITEVVMLKFFSMLIGVRKNTVLLLMYQKSRGISG